MDSLLRRTNRRRDEDNVPPVMITTSSPATTTEEKSKQQQFKLMPRCPNRLVFIIFVTVGFLLTVCIGKSYKFLKSKSFKVQHYDPYGSHTSFPKRTLTTLIQSDNTTTATNLRPCFVAVENKFDFHYEVIESVIMQFPLPWETFNCSKQGAIFDVALTEQNAWTKTNEKERWQVYFETHLAGTARPRSNGDGAVVRFGSIQKYSNYSREYDAYIGVTCEGNKWMTWMNKGPKHYCLFHGNISNWESFRERVCWVSPMHPCYFIPSDLPQFPPEQFHKGDKIRLCLKATTPSTSLYYVVEGVKSLSDADQHNIEVFIMGRSSKMTGALNSILHLIKLGKDPDFYRFQESMSKCHAILPLIHPWEKLGKRYFPWGGKGKLSGYMSQAIGLKLPLLVHEEIHDLYREHLNAPVWSYTTHHIRDTKNFVEAFGKMMRELPDYLAHRTTSKK